MLHFKMSLSLFLLHFPFLYEVKIQDQLINFSFKIGF